MMAVRPNGVAVATLVALDASTLDVLGIYDDHTVIVNAGDAAARASIVVAWDVGTGQVRRLTGLNPYLHISVGDLGP